MLMKKRERFNMNTQKKLAVGFLRRVQLIVLFLLFSFLSTVIYIFNWSHFPIFKYNS